MRPSHAATILVAEDEDSLRQAILGAHRAALGAHSPDRTEILNKVEKLGALEELPAWLSGLIRITAVFARIAPFGTIELADTVGPQLENAMAHTVLLVFTCAD